VTDRPINLVLDTSAIVAYTRASVAVGELLTEVAAEGGVVALPFLCLSQAATLVEDSGLLTLLATHPATEVVGDDPETWPAHAALLSLVGRPDAASAMLASLDFGANLLTGTDRLYAGVGSDRVIPIEEPDE
jgi:hypothetical protein